MSCPKCNAEEIPAMNPRTVYACGSSDYDQRPGTFQQSDECKNNKLLTREIMEAYKEECILPKKHISTNNTAGADAEKRIADLEQALRETISALEVAAIRESQRDRLLAALKSQPGYQHSPTAMALIREIEGGRR